ncbi:hypothetical protein L1987_07742 [Smallanthus sonchifolius]|uniref:Uncharacterized protein n=1 Tax=Smallanthus sonchifolius TaxID=185202 RepID=A0ACB9K134_9ASTR|nr:hypothetical protein L1987_07742 [Smallanthus sonchifolius]
MDISYKYKSGDLVHGNFHLGLHFSRILIVLRTDPLFLFECVGLGRYGWDMLSFCREGGVWVGTLSTLCTTKKSVGRFFLAGMDYGLGGRVGSTLGWLGQGWAFGLSSYLVFFCRWLWWIEADLIRYCQCMGWSFADHGIWGMDRWKNYKDTGDRAGYGLRWQVIKNNDGCYFGQLGIWGVNGNKIGRPNSKHVDQNNAQNRTGKCWFGNLKLERDVKNNPGQGHKRNKQRTKVAFLSYLCNLVAGLGPGLGLAWPLNDFLALGLPHVDLFLGLEFGPYIQACVPVMGKHGGRKKTNPAPPARRQPPRASRLGTTDGDANVDPSRGWNPFVFPPASKLETQSVQSSPVTTVNWADVVKGWNSGLKSGQKPHPPGVYSDLSSPVSMPESDLGSTVVGTTTHGLPDGVSGESLKEKSPSVAHAAGLSTPVMSPHLDGPSYGFQSEICLSEDTSVKVNDDSSCLPASEFTVNAGGLRELPTEVVSWVVTSSVTAASLDVASTRTAGVCMSAGSMGENPKGPAMRVGPVGDGPFSVGFSSIGLSSGSPPVGPGPTPTNEASVGLNCSSGSCCVGISTGPPQVSVLPTGPIFTCADGLEFVSSGPADGIVSGGLDASISGSMDVCSVFGHSDEVHASKPIVVEPVVLEQPKTVPLVPHIPLAQQAQVVDVDGFVQVQSKSKKKKKKKQAMDGGPKLDSVPTTGPMLDSGPKDIVHDVAPSVGPPVSLGPISQAQMKLKGKVHKWTPKHKEYYFHLSKEVIKDQGGPSTAVEVAEDTDVESETDESSC